MNPTRFAAKPGGGAYQNVWMLRWPEWSDNLILGSDGSGPSGATAFYSYGKLGARNVGPIHGGATCSQESQRYAATYSQICGDKNWGPTEIEVWYPEEGAE